jgi:hypothetical protein
MNITQEDCKTAEIKTLELIIDKVNYSKNYIIFDILPAFMFITDRQMSTYIKNINEEPYIAYSLLFQWLGFSIDLTYNKKIKYEKDIN